MKGVSIKCPNCGARVSVKAEQDDVTCTYCGNTCVVRRRSKVLERPMPPRAAVDGRKVATAGHSLGWAIGFTATMIGIGAAIFAGVKQCSARGGGPAALTEWRWDGVDSVILTDVNGEGTVDAVGRVRVLQPEDAVAIAAFDGRNGKRLWKTEKLGTRSDILHTSSGYVPGTVIVGGGVGELIGIASLDGSIKWRIRLSEKIDRLCAGDADAFIIAETADKRRQKLAVADGRVEATAGDTPCVPLPNDSPRAPAADRLLYSWHGEHADEVPREVEGMRIDGAIHHPPSGTTIGVGCKQPGTNVAMVARIAPDGTSALWTATVPAGDPLAAPSGSAEEAHTGVDGDGVAVAYNVKFAHHYRVTLFTAADGRRLWDVEVPGENPMAAVRLSPTHVFVGTWGGLFAYDRATGTLAYTVD